MSNEKYMSELRTQFEIIMWNIEYTYTVAYDIQYLFNADGKEYHKRALGGYHLIPMIKESVKSHFSLKLAILLDQKGDFSLVKFLRRLQSEYRMLEKPKLGLTELQSLEKEVLDSKESAPIRAVLHFRNKIYAHLDKKAEDTDLKTVQERVLPYINRYREISELLSTEIFGIGILRPPEHFRMKLILDHLSDYNHIRDLMKQVKYKRKSGVVTLDELENCVKVYK